MTGPVGESVQDLIYKKSLPESADVYLVSQGMGQVGIFRIYLVRLGKKFVAAFTASGKV
mgnify:CR=1 FL=1